MILVTGATGLSGSFVVHELQRRGLAVRALVREASVPAAQALNVDLAIGDLADPDSLRRACDGVTGIVHTACTFTDSNVDIAAMQALLDGWRSIPFVYFSSLDVYGLSTASPIVEDTPSTRPTTTTPAARSLATSINSATHIWAPHPTARKRLASLVGSDTVLLPGADEADWLHYRDAWIDARDLAWIVAECLAYPIGGPANILAGHFVWHDVFTEIIRVTGSSCHLVHKPLTEMTGEERASRRFYAQSWRYDDRYLQGTLAFQSNRTWQQTVLETLDRS